MNTQDAEAQLMRMLKPLWKYFNTRCASLEDAEDLASETMRRVLEHGLSRVENLEAYTWTVARNTLATSRARMRHSYYGTGFDPDLVEDQRFSIEQTLVKDERVRGLRQALALLGDQQRSIMTDHYFFGRSVADIARRMGLSEGTVKWHLHDARKQMRQEVTTMSDLSHTTSFDPVTYRFMGTSGSIGTRGGTREILRSALSQNIIYVCYREPKSTREIAELLGVSPVYVSSELEFLVYHQFLLPKGRDRYLSNVLIDQYDQQLWSAEKGLYESVTRLAASSCARYDP